MSPSKLAITVLAGGPSAEREVSLKSGNAMARALERRGHDVFVSDIAPDNLAALERACDVVVIGLHGAFGEDGTLQRLLEQRKIPFTGSGTAASALAMNKIESKKIALACGAKTAAWQHVTNANRAQIEPTFKLPIVIKPVDSGSSVATYVLRGEMPAAAPASEGAEAIKAALDDVLGRFGQALVEQFIAGEEMTVAVLEGQALPPIVIRARQGFYDYHAKYLAGDTEYVFDALPPAVLVEAQRRSEAIFARMNCRHLARVDWIVDGVGTLWFLEVNTLPGFTDTSLVPKAAARVGISFDDLCEKLARLGAKESR